MTLLHVLQLNSVSISWHMGFSATCRPLLPWNWVQLNWETHYFQKGHAHIISSAHRSSLLICWSPLTRHQCEHLPSKTSLILSSSDQLHHLSWYLWWDYYLAGIVQRVYQIPYFAWLGWQTSFVMPPCIECVSESESEVVQSCPTLRLRGLLPTRLLRRQSTDKSTGVGCPFILQGIFLTQGSNLGLPHCRQTLYHLSHREAQCSNVLVHAPVYVYVVYVPFQTRRILLQTWRIEMITTVLTGHTF